MSTGHSTENAGRGFDMVPEALEKGFQWAVSNAAALIIGTVVLLTVAGGATLWSKWSSSKEEELQSRYFLLEKRLTDLQRGFEEAEREAAARAGQTTPAAKDAPVKPKATGDLAKDYGTLPADFLQLIEAAPASKAAQMAALNLADLQVRHGQPEQALGTLGKIQDADRPRDFLTSLVVHQRASLMADQGDCAGAIPLWERLTAEQSGKFLRDEAKLRMALCADSVGDSSRAEQLLAEVTAEPASQNPAMGESAAAQDAARYLRLLRTRKGSQ